MYGQMPRSGFGTKDEEQQLPSNLTTDAATPDKDDLDEIGKISYMLNPNEEVFVIARQSRLKPGGSKFTPNVIFATDRRIIIKDPSMFGLREDIVDIPYDMISSVRIDKGVFSSNVIFKAPGLINSSRRGKLDRLMMIDKDEIRREQVGEEEDGIITAIPKDKAEELLEVIRNGMDKDREVSYRHNEEQPLQAQQSSVSISDELSKLANLKQQGMISQDEFQQMKQDLINKKMRSTGY
jgi:PH (Pleckstrin Homology) domain-containing protein/putative oligomerization/nucleic acid binding protein